VSRPVERENLKLDSWSGGGGGRSEGGKKPVAGGGGGKGSNIPLKGKEKDAWPEHWEKRRNGQVPCQVPRKGEDSGEEKTGESYQTESQYPPVEKEKEGIPTPDREKSTIILFSIDKKKP